MSRVLKLTSPWVTGSGETLQHHVVTVLIDGEFTTDEGLRLAMHLIEQKRAQLRERRAAKTRRLDS